MSAREAAFRQGAEAMRQSCAAIARDRSGCHPEGDFEPCSGTEAGGEDTHSRIARNILDRAEATYVPPDSKPSARDDGEAPMWVKRALSETKHTGGPAHPHVLEEGAYKLTFDGLTIRDHFAAAALTGLYAANPPIESKRPPGEIAARASYAVADAMLAERAKASS